MKHIIELDNAPSKGVLSPMNLNKIKFQHLTWMQSITFAYPSSSRFKIKISFAALDRTDKKSTNLVYEKFFNRKAFKKSQDLLSEIRKMAKYVVCHEIDECLYFSNKRIFDPHK